MNPADIARELTRELERAGFTADTIAAHLGPDATEALHRGEPGAVLEACDDSVLSGLIRFFLLRQPMSCLLYTSPSPRDRQKSRMPSSA